MSEDQAQTEEQQVIDAVREYAERRYSEPVYIWDLEQQGIPEDQISELQFKDNRLVVTIKDVQIVSRDEDGDYYVEVDASPEIEDAETFIASVNDDGSIIVDWHGV